MNWADVAIVAVLAISVIVSLFRGFIKEVFSILVWVAAVFAAFQVATPLAESLAPFIELPSARVIVAFAAVFVLVLVVGGLISFLIGKMVEKTGLSPTDRLFGMLFGLGRGLVIVVVAVMLLRATPFAQDPWWRESRLLPTFELLAQRAHGYVPEGVRGLLQSDTGQDGPASPDALAVPDLTGNS
jgi:membrane protein required for colicin V production